MRTSRILLSWAFVIACGATAFAQTDARSPFVFAARTPDGRPAGWGGGPRATLMVDSTVVRSAPYAARIQRVTGSEGEFSALTMRLPATFTGQTLELRGWLRLENVSDWAGLWLRQDGDGRQVLAFDNMQQRKLSGTIDWTEYSIRLPLHAGAREIYLGALVAGTGTAWVDDVQLLVDGKPFSEAPPRQLAPTDTAFANGSGIGSRTLERRHIDNLVLLGKVWGFAKYHHPRITARELDWDDELFRIMPSVLDAPDRAAAARAIDQWLARVGDPKPCTACATVPQRAHLLPGLDWIRDERLLGPQLSARLQIIHRNRHASGPQGYVSLNPNVGNPDFQHENAYTFDAASDAGYRLLALYRFWNIIEYWFPYRDVIGAEWDDVLAEAVPRFARAQNANDYRLELMRLSARIHDTHSNTWGDLALRPPRGNAELPVTLRFIDSKAVVTGHNGKGSTPASGLRRGDVIEAIDGQRVDSLVAAWRPFYSASNEPTRLRDIALSLTRGDTGAVTLRVLRGATRITVNARRISRAQLDLARARVHDLPGEAFQHLSDDVAYLKLSGVKVAQVPDYVRRAAGARVLVIDIRNYPGEFVVFALGGHLVAERTPFVRFTTGDLANPGAFIMGEPLALAPATPRIEARIVILVDETTQSSAEYHAMAFRAAPGALVVGSTTAGADGNVSRIPLPGPSAGMISGIGVFYPDGRPTQRIGIVPDLVVRPTIEGIRAGRDEVLEAAVTRALGRAFRMPQTK